MEEIEEANRAAIESCQRVIDLLSLPQDQVQYRNLSVETGETVVKFKKVVSLLVNGLGHLRVRKHNTLKLPFSQSILLDNKNGKTNYQSKNLQLPQTSFPDNSIWEFGSSIENSLCLGKQSLELSSNKKSHFHLNQGLSPTHHNIPKPQQMLQPMLQQQCVKHQTEMAFPRKNRVINLNFESSSFTTSMPPTRYFSYPFGIDGRVANFDGSGFHLVGVVQSSDQNSQHKGKSLAKSDDDNMKYGSSSICNCSKNRLYLDSHSHIFDFASALVLLLWSPTLISLYILYMKSSLKRLIKVSAISTKPANIPPDGYSWRKYGQKILRGTPHPRGYYKCTSMIGCPATKYVERSVEESSMLMVTYKGDHNHPKSVTQTTNA